MTIVVNPHNPKEEQALLAFLDSMKYDYAREDETLLLSDAQQQEILERDRQYETGETESYSLEEIIANDDQKGNKRIPGGLKGKVSLPDDFNEPIDDLKDYM